MIAIRQRFGMRAMQRFFSSSAKPGPLAGLRVLDFSRILAGPSGTQMLGDMGADVIKIERPRVGDDTRNFAPPFLPKEDGSLSDMAAYFAGINRNKRSVTLDYTKPDGLLVAKKLLASSDIFVENFKTGGLAKYGLGYDQIKEEFPGLIYCSITGFGHSGPYSPRPGYDMLIQAMGGIMSITGEPDGQPMKVGISMCDLTAGLHAVVGILAALRHKSVTGQGQHVDIGMLDVTVAMLANQGMNYLATKKRNARLGNDHPNIVPYQVLPSSDGFFIITCGNDTQFEAFCKVGGCEDLLKDDKCSTAVARVTNRKYCTEKVEAVTRTKPSNWWLSELEKVKVGCAPIMNIDEVFADPHVLARGMKHTLEIPAIGGKADVIGSPLKFSESPVSFRTPPGELGEHTDAVLKEAGYSAQDIEGLRSSGAV